MIDNNILKFAREVNDFADYLNMHSSWEVVWENDEVEKDKILREIYDNEQQGEFEQYQKDRIKFSELMSDGQEMCDSEKLFELYIKLDKVLQEEEYEMAEKYKNDIINFKDELFPGTNDEIQSFGLEDEKHEEIIIELITNMFCSEIKRWKHNSFGHIEMITNFDTDYGKLSKIYAYSDNGSSYGNIELTFIDKKVIFHPKAFLFNKLFKKMNSLYTKKYPTKKKVKKVEKEVYDHPTESDPRIVKMASPMTKDEIAESGKRINKVVEPKKENIINMNLLKSIIKSKWNSFLIWFGWE